MYLRKNPQEYYCTIDFALSIFGGKWKARILCMLSHYPSLRYGRLKSELEDISDAALADCLRELQQEGIVDRHQYNEMPVRVEYSLTSKGMTLLPVLATISQWSVEHSTPEMYKGTHFKNVHLSSFSGTDK